MKGGPQADHGGRAPHHVGVFVQASDLFRGDRYAGRQDEKIIGESEPVDPNLFTIWIKALHPPLVEDDMVGPRNVAQIDLQRLGHQAEGDIRQVGSEQEVLPVGEERHRSPIAEALAHIKRCFKSPEPASDDHDPDLLFRFHGSLPAS